MAAKLDQSYIDKLKKLEQQAGGVLASDGKPSAAKSSMAKAAKFKAKKKA